MLHCVIGFELSSCGISIKANRKARSTTQSDNARRQTADSVLS